MKIVVAPDSFKGSLTALEAARAMERGCRAALPFAAVELVPMADGGEGFTEAILAATGGEWVEVEARDPLGRPIRARFGWLAAEKTAVIETAAASGLTLLKPEERNPLAASTYGTGQLMRAALDRGCKHILLGLGGSATNDGGVGMAQALGFRFTDADGREIAPFTQDWHRIAAVDATAAHPRLREAAIVAACDVDAPLLGETGASAVFGPQKGADAEAVRLLDAALARLADAIRRGLGVDVTALSGGGAAGGLGAGLRAFCGARLERGVDLVLAACRFDRKLDGASLVLTGEGKTDEQTALGKTAAGVAARAQRAGVPVVCLSGALGDGCERLHALGIDALFSIVPKPCSLEEAMERAGEWLEAAAAQAVRLFAVGRGAGDAGERADGNNRQR